MRQVMDAMTSLNSFFGDAPDDAFILDLADFIKVVIGRNDVTNGGIFLSRQPRKNSLDIGNYPKYGQNVSDGDSHFVAAFLSTIPIPRSSSFPPSLSGLS